MIISQTPFRMSFFGGGTDYPAWFREHGGAVLSVTLDRYCYMTCRWLPPFFDHRSRIVWSQIETVNDHAEISHPAVAATLKHLDITRGIELYHNGDLPARAGLGSSSSFTVGLLNVLHTLKGEAVSKEDLAKEAIYVEQELIGENVGIQDQIATAFGGLNHITIAPTGKFEVAPIGLTPERQADLSRHLLLFFTGISRHASRIAKDVIESIPAKQTEINMLAEMVEQALKILRGNGDLADFGRLLHESWQVKRSLTKSLAPTFVGEIYDRARKAGAIGGKLLGAGGGGFMVFVVKPEDHLSVLEALDELLMVPVGFDEHGTRIIFESTESFSKTALNAAHGHHHSNGDDA